MCIHNFSKQYFRDYASKVLKPDYYSTILTQDGFGTMHIKQEHMDPAESFKANKVSYFDIADLFFNLEKKYHMNMFFIDIAKIDNINEAYDVFVNKIYKMRRDFAKTQNNKGHKKMTQQKITYNQIVRAAQKCLIEDPELQLNPQDVVSTAKLSGWNSLHLDDTAKLQLIMGLEQAFNIEIDDDVVLNKKPHNLGEFCCAVYENIKKPNPAIEQQQITSSYTNSIDNFMAGIKKDDAAEDLQTIAEQFVPYKDIFQIIQKHLKSKYNKHLVKLGSNWYVNLGLSEFDKCNFFEWVEKTFNIKLPYFYFENIDALCRVIYAEKMKENNLINRIKKHFSRSK